MRQFELLTTLINPWGIVQHYQRISNLPTLLRKTRGSCSTLDSIIRDRIFRSMVVETARSKHMRTVPPNCYPPSMLQSFALKKLLQMKQNALILCGPPNPAQPGPNQLLKPLRGWNASHSRRTLTRKSLVDHNVEPIMPYLFMVPVNCNLT